MQEANLFRKPTASFPTDPLAASVILDISARSGSIVDAKGRVLTNTNVGIDTTQMKYGPSMSFTGHSYLQMPNTDGKLWFSSGFCIDMWIYLISKTASYPSVFGNYDTWPNPNGLQWFMTHSGVPSTGYLVAAASTFPALTSPGAVIYGAWTHIALERSGTTLTQYINGVRSGVASGQQYTFQGSMTKVTIGSPQDALSGGGINGFIDRYRVTNVVRYGGEFTPGKF